ncbi:hypothetical protein LTR15_009526 [Elasticomyces elasticus]|nr:hypothetical protein LTR15_009526 [Elasticomyces elasticus]
MDAETPQRDPYSDLPDDLSEWLWTAQTKWTASRAFFAFRDGFSMLNLQYRLSKAAPKLHLRPYFDPSYRGRQRPKLLDLILGRQAVSSTDFQSPHLDESNASYEYSALAPNHIRLLHIEPALADVPISCTLVDYPLDALPEFQALSYTWGEASCAHSIFINLQSFRLRRNAFAALTDLRSANEPVVVWCDAICINQEDDVERSAQIQLMRRIYTAASRVPIWIIPASEDTGTALALIARLCGLSKMIVVNRPLTPELLSACELPESDSTQWQALSKFLWSAWFTRVWIIQEVSLAREAVIVCGADTCPWTDLVGAVAYIADRSLTTAVDIDPSQVLRLETVIADARKKPSVVELARFARHSNASDARDKLYALLGLASDGDSVVPDYTTPVRKCYTDFAFRAMQDMQTLDILNAIDHWGYYAASQSSLYGLPSWVPNWSVVGLSERLPGNVSSDERRLPLRRVDDDTIEVHGRVIDTVSKAADTFVEWVPHVGNSVPGSTAVDWLTESLYRKRWRQWQAIGWGASSYPSGQDPKEAYVRTIIADIFKGIRLDKVEVCRLYETWVRFWKAVGAERGRHLGTYIVNSSMTEVEDALRFMAAHREAAYGRRFVTTKGGYFGLCPFQTRRGDCIVGFAGGSTPYVIRKSGSCGGIQRWTVLGECYVHDLPYTFLVADPKPLMAFVLC